MKKLFLLLAVALPCLIFTACGDDDDDDSTPANGTTSDNKPQGGSQGSGESTGDKPTAKVGNAVDLGLSVKWADMNVGASSPEDYGDYFAWGETEPKEVYDWSTYKWCNGSFDSLTKYCNDSYWWGYNGFKDNKTTLDPADDAATANWGGAWRMPTYEEQTELRTKCTWTWTTQNGVKGYKVTSKSNGRSIFLPAAGYRNDSDLNLAGSDGLYWSSSLPVTPINAFRLNFFGSGGVDWDSSLRNIGLSVRPVCQ